jgi:uncharacterized protein DUF1996
VRGTKPLVELSHGRRYPDETVSRRASSVGCPPLRTPSRDGRNRTIAGSIAAGGLLLVAIGVIFLSVVQQAAPAAVARTVAAGFPGGPHFVVSCGFSHRNNDDAIVFSGKPGLSHNHTYIGNFAVDASTTPSSLVGGRSTCDFEADASAYWAPTLYVGRRALLPLAGFAYYVKRTATPVAAIPAGLKMVAGNSKARRSQPTQIAAWSCSELGGGPRFATVPACARNHLVQLQITFPNCWNGTAVDSPDHRRHMAYSSARECPTSHPIAVPTLVLILLYPETMPQAQVSSGRFAIHGDFMNGWDQRTLETLVAALN